MLNTTIRGWIQNHTGNILSADKLAGSTSTTLYRITTNQGDYVLRLYDNESWLAIEPDLCEHEATALQIASQSDLPTPQLIAHEPDSSIAPLPLLLMQHLPGEIILKPQNMQNYLTQLAETLARIHRIPAPDFPWKHYRYTRIERLKIPPWTDHPATWEQIINILKQPEPPAKQVFLHRDYHMTNLLWQNNKISAVVDWINACTGSAGIDTGHMRVNMAQLYGIEIADQFLHAYQHANPEFDYPPYYDFVALADVALYDESPPAVYPPWLEFGMTGLSDSLMQSRIEAYAQHLINII